MNDNTTPSSVPVDRTGVEIVPFLECEKLLENAGIGRVAMVVAGEPVILPVNYRYVSGCVVFRSAVGTQKRARFRIQLLRFNLKSTSTYIGDRSEWTSVDGIIEEQLAHPKTSVLALKVFLHP